MNPSGAVLIVVAIWLGCQVFGGNALERLNLVPPKAT